MPDEDKLVIEFVADKIYIYGPKADGSFSVKFDTGEYMQLEMSKLMAISQHNMIRVKVEPVEDVR